MTIASVSKIKNMLTGSLSKISSIFISQEKDVAREKIRLSELAITNAVGSPHTDTYFRQIRTRILNNLSHEEIFGVSYVNFKSALELKHSVRRYYKVQ